jgi:hypothetical protein
MRRGAVRVAFAPGTTVAAPPSGVHLGSGASGPLSLRLFRSAGTRIVLAGEVFPAQLIAVRAGACGAAVHVVSARPRLWGPLLRHCADGRIVEPGVALPPPSGPTLLIEDRPAQARVPADARPWQCRLDVRTHWSPSELMTFIHADVVVFGMIPRELAGTVASAFGVPAEATAPLSTLAAGLYALVCRGRLEYVSLDPTPAESQVLALAR